jgi:hypothetical protein
MNAKDIALELLRKPLDEDYLYHGTSHASANHIQQHGIDPDKSKYHSRTYLTTKHAEAQKYSKIAQGSGHGKVFRVHRKHLDPKHIDSDHAGIVQYRGKIHPKHIELAETKK